MSGFYKRGSRSNSRQGRGRVRGRNVVTSARFSTTAAAAICTGEAEIVGGTLRPQNESMSQQMAQQVVAGPVARPILRKTVITAEVHDHGTQATQSSMDIIGEGEQPSSSPASSPGPSPPPSEGQKERGEGKGSMINLQLSSESLSEEDDDDLDKDYTPSPKKRLREVFETERTSDIHTSEEEDEGEIGGGGGRKQVEQPLQKSLHNTNREQLQKGTSRQKPLYGLFTKQPIDASSAHPHRRRPEATAPANPPQPAALHILPIDAGACVRSHGHSPAATVTASANPAQPALQSPPSRQIPTPSRQIQRSEVRSSSKPQSTVWNFFTIENVQKSRLAKCTLCHKTVSRGQGGNLGTSSLRAHLKRHHASVWGESQKKVQIPHPHPPQSPTVPPLSPPPPSSSLNSPESEQPLLVPVASPSSRSASTVAHSPSPATPRARRTSTTPMLQPTVMQAFQRGQKYDKAHDKARLLTAKTAVMLAVDILPYTFVEKAGFRDLMAVADPRWEIPSRHFFAQTAVPQLYNEVAGAIKTLLSRCEGKRVHMTMDLWTSGQSIDYMAMTAHWVTFPSTTEQSQSQAQQQGHAVRQQATLCMESFDGRAHTGADLWDKVQEVVGKWLTPCQLQLGFVAADNGSNVIVALRTGGIMHVPCFAHVLHLIVTHFIGHYPPLHDMVGTVQKICSHFSRSYKSRNALSKLQVHHGLPCHRLKTAIPTRWNSTLHMLERVHEQRNAISDYCNTNSRALDGAFLTPTQWHMLSVVCYLLKPFEEATQRVSQQNSCLSEVLPLLYLLEKELSDLQKEHSLRGDTDAAQMAAKLHSTLRVDPRIVVMKANTEYMLATFLDPRFKTKVVDFHQYIGVDENELQRSSGLGQEPDILTECKNALTARLLDVLTEENRQQQNSSRSEQEPLPCTSLHSDDSRALIPLPAERHKRLWDKLLPRSDLPHASPHSQSAAARGPTAEQMVDAYLLDTCQLGHEEDPLQFWLSKRSVWPAALVKLAIESLSCPAASVQCERVFSAAGAIVTEKRRKLSEVHVQQLTFIKMNQHHIPMDYGKKKFYPTPQTVSGLREEDPSVSGEGVESRQEFHTDSSSGSE